MLEERVLAMTIDESGAAYATAIGKSRKPAARGTASGEPQAGALSRP